MLKRNLITASLALAIFSIGQSSFALDPAIPPESTGAAAPETMPTANTPMTPEQQRAHQEVSAKQRNLKRKLKQNAPPSEIGKAKAAVQTERVDANMEDVKRRLQEEEAKRIQNQQQFQQQLPPTAPPTPARPNPRMQQPNQPVQPGQPMPPPPMPPTQPPVQPVK